MKSLIKFLLCPLVSLLILCCACANAQWYNPEKVNKKAAATYTKAYEAAEAEEYKLALQLTKKAIEADTRFVDAWLTAAGIYANLKKYDSSVYFFEQGIALDTVYTTGYLLPYSISLAGIGQFERALTAVNQFLANPTLNERSIKAGQYRKSVYEFALDFAKKHPADGYHFVPVNAGDSLNSAEAEYYPSLTIDGSKMVFTRRVNRDEDFFESSLVNGQWQKATPLAGMVNTNLNEGAQNQSQDGDWIIFTGCNYPEGLGSCDLYISYKTNRGWSEPQNMGSTINTDFWESSPSLSPDKKDLYFSSDRPGGFGGRDLWVSHRQQNGQWTKPQNLGAVINTNGHEGSAFIHADNTSLYFNSNGHTGYGETDLFVAKKQPDSTWQKPLNLGYPINTINDEGSLIVSADGLTAWYASEGADTRGALDLYQFSLPVYARPLTTRWVRGQVLDATTKLGLPATVILTDIDNRSIISRIQTDEYGHYLTTLPAGKNYAFTVNRKGYLFYSANYNLQEHHDSSFTADIPLQPLAAGANIVLNNIFFDSKQWELKPASTTELDQVKQLLLDNPNLRIVIEGHTDNIGQPKDNLLLSEKRALAVVSYLLTDSRLRKDRLQYKGLGATVPIADNSTETGRATNRRTALSVISN
jgi:outer membrane protein OmpA-like peptidoglycan-associated protein/tetratricopeptide (TPR) repeat protein